MNKNIGIYKFQNKINGIVYIGQSIHLDTRYNEHRRNCLNKKHINYYCDFYKALREFGFDNFNYEIIEYCDENRLNEREVYWIAKYDSYHNGYNMTPGGDFNPSKVPEIVKKRTEKLLNVPEINKKLASRGGAKISIEDVIQIRTLYKDGKTFSEAYSLFKDKLSYSGFQQCWRGKTWSEIMPEVYQDRIVENTGGSKLNSNIIKQLRIDYMNGFSKEQLIAKYNVSKPNLNRILNLSRWNRKEAIPENYKTFIFK